MPKKKGNNIWILSEEKPRLEVIELIIKKFALGEKLGCKVRSIKIVPIIKNNKFVFIYSVEGIKCDLVDSIFIKLVSGDSSFADFLLFYQTNQPDQNSRPLYLIEETKTDDRESRNTGVYQRSSKFIYANFFYPGIPQIMLYNLRMPQKKDPTPTYIFGTKMLLTFGVQIMGKILDKNVFKTFKDIDELIKEKNAMRDPYNGVPVKITKKNNKIEISAKLSKGGRLSHDPNIGMTTIISACLRKLGWRGEIIITKHKLQNQQSVGTRNKFIKIANQLDIKIDKLKVPFIKLGSSYWHYEKRGEKISSIFIHLVVEFFSKGRVVYENHAGSERGYFLTKKGKYISIDKYQKGKRKKYKSGNKRAIINIPDLIIYDGGRNEIVNIEGKTYKNRKQGIKKLNNYNYIEDHIIKPSYKPKKVIRTVILFGGDKNKLKNNKISFLLNENGDLILNSKAPGILKESIANLLTS